MRRVSTRLVPLASWDTVQSSAARLSPVNIFEAALSLQGLIMRQGLGRGRKRQIPCTDRHRCSSFWGEGACYRRCHCALSHGTVPLEQLVSRRRAAKLLRLCPPLLSFQW